MEDIEMPSQDLAAGTDLGASVQEGVSTDQPGENQKNATENGKTSASEDDKTGTLPSDVHMSENQVLPDEKITTSDADVNDAGSVQVPQSKDDGDGVPVHDEPGPVAFTPPGQRKSSTPKPKHESGAKSKGTWTDVETGDADESGTPEERAAFMRDLETFCTEHHLEFKPPKFYGEPLNCLKLWRAVIKLGGYEVVTASKLWRQVGESFHPPKTCTTVSWTFRIFYEKALLEYEKHKRQNGELQLPSSPIQQPASVEKEVSGYQAPGSGRQRRDAAARAMQGWHAQRLLGHGEVSEPIIKDRSVNSVTRREKPLKRIGILPYKWRYSFGWHISDANLHFYLVLVVESGLHKQKSNLELSEISTNIETDKELRYLIKPLKIDYSTFFLRLLSIFSLFYFAPLYCFLIYAI